MLAGCGRVVALSCAGVGVLVHAGCFDVHGARWHVWGALTRAGRVRASVFWHVACDDVSHDVGLVFEIPSRGSGT